MTVLHGAFDIVGIMIAAADDDQIFKTTRDEQLAVPEHTQVSRPEKRSFSACGQACVECRLGLFFPLPVALCHGGTTDPDFSLLAIIAGQAGIRMDDANRLPAPRLATAYDPVVPRGMCPRGARHVAG